MFIPASRIAELGTRSVSLVQEFTPQALTILNSIPSGSDRTAAQAVLPGFLKLAAEFRFTRDPLYVCGLAVYRDTVLEVCRLADSVESIGTAIFANSGIKFPATIGKVRGRRQIL